MGPVLSLTSQGGPGTVAPASPNLLLGGLRLRATAAQVVATVDGEHLLLARTPALGLGHLPNRRGGKAALRQIRFPLLGSFLKTLESQGPRLLELKGPLGSSVGPEGCWEGEHGAMRAGFSVGHVSHWRLLECNFYQPEEKRDLRTNCDWLISWL